jgi:hypothetical protein
MIANAFVAGTVLIGLGWAILRFVHVPDKPLVPIFGWAFIVLGVGAFLSVFTAKKAYCADCGQFLGRDPGVCPRCGCNVYTTRFTGVGRTTRLR